MAEDVFDKVLVKRDHTGGPEGRFDELMLLLRAEAEANGEDPAFFVDPTARDRVAWLSGYREALRCSLEELGRRPLKGWEHRHINTVSAQAEEHLQRLLRRGREPARDVAARLRGRSEMQSCALCLAQAVDVKWTYTCVGLGEEPSELFYAVCAKCQALPDADERARLEFARQSALRRSLEGDPSWRRRG